MSSPKKNIIVLGAGIAGLTAAIDLASKGHSVKVIEKNAQAGGRGVSFSELGFKFDMGPSWYWMPDVFEDYFQKHQKSTKDYFNLIRLDPSYRIFFKESTIDSPSNIEDTYQIFDQLETGSATFLKKFLKEAKYKYDVGMKEFVQKPSLSFVEYLDWRLIKSAFKLQMTRSIESIIDRSLKHPYLRAWLKFPVLFLGAKPKDTPALYSLMNYADLVLGTWYPEGGMEQLFKALYQLALEKNVEFHFNEEVTSLCVEKKSVVQVQTIKSEYKADFVVSSADYHHTETKLLEPQFRQYTESYWEKRQLAPSALIFYLGLSEKVEGLLHHNLFFDEDFENHSSEIYDKKIWPEKPLFYVCAPSKTDPTVAPIDNENLFILIPITAGIKDTEIEREKLFQIVLKRLEHKLNNSLEKKIVFKRSYCIQDFIQDYNSFKGNAYGLSNILSQTAFLKPRIKHRKIKNLYFAGQLTHPGPGLPPSLISGEIAASLILNECKI